MLTLTFNLPPTVVLKLIRKSIVFFQEYTDYIKSQTDRFSEVPVMEELKVGQVSFFT